MIHCLWFSLFVNYKQEILFKENTIRKYHSELIWFWFITIQARYLSEVILEFKEYASVKFNLKTIHTQNYCTYAS